MVKHKKNVSKNLTTKLENLILSAKFLTQFFKHFFVLFMQKVVSDDILTKNNKKCYKP